MRRLADDLTVPALYRFGSSASVEAAAGAPGAHGVHARVDYVSLSIKSGRNSVDLHVAVETAEAMGRALLRQAEIMRVSAGRGG